MQWVSKVATAADGRFVVVWDQAGEDANFVTARLFDAAGRPRSGDLRVARVVKPLFGRPAVSMAPDGRRRPTPRSPSPPNGKGDVARTGSDASDSGIFARLLRRVRP